LRAELRLMQATEKQIRQNAEAYKSAFGTGLKAFITGEGTFADIFTGVGRAAFDINVDSLVKKMDKVFMGMAGTKGVLGRGFMGALQGYMLSGGRGIGAIASGIGAMLPGTLGQIGALAGALFRRDETDPVESQRRYDSRIEWENRVLEQLVLANRNLIGLREGGTFALAESYYYRERTNETLAGSLELAMRGA
jgi:hypothetical protein